VIDDNEDSLVVGMGLDLSSILNPWVLIR